jgi:hypothetical protein
MHHHAFDQHAIRLPHAHAHPSRSRPRATSPKRFRPNGEALEQRWLLDAAAGHEQLAAAYGQLPLTFEINQGQTDGQVNFLAHGPGYGLFLTQSGVVLSLHNQSAPASGFSPLPPHDSPTFNDVLQMDFVGDNPETQAVGVEPLASVSNYLIGNDPSKWHTNVATYDRVEYQDLYPGVSLDYYGNQGQLEYDFVVDPGADPAAIRFTVAGAQTVSLDAQGDLVLHASGGDVVEHAPVIYQTINGVRQEVAGGYVLLPTDDLPSTTHQIAFAVGAYDHSRALVIDPILSYCTYLGGSGNELANAIAVDAAGNAYVTGLTGSTNFPTTAGALQSAKGAGFDGFVAKLNAAGTGLVYATYLGGSGDDFPTGITVDATGKAYVTGDTNSTDFPTTTGALQTSNGGGQQDAFVAKLNATGSALVYSTYLGGNDLDVSSGIAVDSSGNAYVTGFTASTNFPTTAGALQSAKGAGGDGFVAKLNAAGTGLVYSTYLGGSGDDLAEGIAVDAAGDAFVTGTTDSTNFPTTAGALQASNAGGDDAFVSKLNAAGSALVYSTYLGGSGDDVAEGIAVDSAGNAYVTGFTVSTNLPTTAGALQTSSAGGDKAFVAKLNAAGTGLVYSTYLGGNGTDVAYGIAVDAAGEAYLAGATNSTNFPTTPGAPQTSFAGATVGQINGDFSGDAFVAKLNVAGTALVYSTYLGGSNDDLARAIAVDAAGEAYLAGSTMSTNFPTIAGALQTSTVGGFVHAFVFKLATAPLNLCAAGVAAIEGAPFTGVVGFLVDEAQAFDPAGNFTVLVAWGDGSTSTATVVPHLNGFNLLANHTYTEDGNYAMTVTVIDADGDSTAADGTAAVADAPLTGTGTLASFLTGVSANPTVATFQDADPRGWAGDYLATIDWGDGSPVSFGTITANGAGFDVSGAHAYAAVGNDTIAVSIVDQHGGSHAVVTSTATVQRADSLTLAVPPLVLTQLQPFSGAVATFTDTLVSAGAGDFTALIGWGDGTSSTGAVVASGAGFAILGSHTYSVSGAFSLSVSVQTVRGQTSTAAGTSTVADAPLTPLSRSANFSEGISASAVVASFTDADPLATPGDYPTVIYWGDGSSSAGAVSANAGGFDVAGTHTYAEEGTYSVKAVIADQGAGQVFALSTAHVAGGVVLQGLAGDIVVFGHMNFSGSVATFTDPDTQDTVTGTVTDYAAMIAWGDGSSSSGAVSFKSANGTFTVSGAHTYQNFSDTIQLTVTVTDNGGAESYTATDTLVDPPYPGGPNQLYAAQVYQDLFGQAPASSTVVAGTSLAAWAGQLDAGTSRAAFASAMVHSADYYASIIRPIYEHYLGREPDAAGLSYWVAQMQAGLTDERLEAGFIGSAEFYTHAGGTDKLWVDFMYQDLLGRAADSAGESYWVAQLAAGANRSSVAYGFAASLERERLRVQDDYFHYLGRQADSAGVDYWVTAFAHGTANEDVIAGFIASDEYFAGHAG